MGPTIFIPHEQASKRMANSTIIDSILQEESPFIHITNDTNTPIHFKKVDFIGIIKSDQYYNLTSPENQSQTAAFFNLVAPILDRKFLKKESSEEQPYQDQQPDLPYSPKLTEIPKYEDISTKEFLSTLDFNPKLLKSQKELLQQIVLKHRKAFSLNGRIGECSDIKYTIKLKDEAIPISMPPYHASPEK